MALPSVAMRVPPKAITPHLKSDDADTVIQAANALALLVILRFILDELSAHECT